MSDGRLLKKTHASGISLQCFKLGNGHAFERKNRAWKVSLQGWCWLTQSKGPGRILGFVSQKEYIAVLVALCILYSRFLSFVTWCENPKVKARTYRVKCYVPGHLALFFFYFFRLSFSFLDRYVLIGSPDPAFLSGTYCSLVLDVSIVLFFRQVCDLYCSWRYCSVTPIVRDAYCSPLLYA